MSSYKLTWETILKNPLTGGGTGSIYIAENIFFEVLSNVGIIGFILFIMFLYSAGKKGCQYLIKIYPHQDISERGIGLMVLIITVALFVDKQVSYELAGDKDRFTFIGIAINLSHMKK